MIRLTHATCRRFRGIFEYLVPRDYNAGKARQRYTVLALNSTSPVVIGRELELKSVRSLIADYEIEAAKLPCWIGERKDILACMKRVRRKRLTDLIDY